VLTMNSVKILHAVRSAMTAIAELLVEIMFKRIVADECYLFTSNYRSSCGVAADNASCINFGFKQFVIDVVSYAAANPL